MRCRPMSRKEVEDSRVRIVEMDTKTGEVLASQFSLPPSRHPDVALLSQVWVKNPEADPREQSKPFTFDQVSTSRSASSPVVAASPFLYIRHGPLAAWWCARMQHRAVALLHAALLYFYSSRGAHMLLLLLPLLVDGVLSPPPPV